MPGQVESGGAADDINGVSAALVAAVSCKGCLPDAADWVG